MSQLVQPAVYWAAGVSIGQVSPQGTGSEKNMTGEALLMGKFAKMVN